MEIRMAWGKLNPVFKDALQMRKDVFIEEYRKLGPMSKQEKITAAILIGTFLMFVTSSLHGISDAAVCLTAWFLLTASGIIKVNEISSGINWDLIVFVGTAMGFGSVFAATGVSEWISSILVNAVAPITSSPWLFVFAVLLIMFIWRFVDIAIFIPTMAIITAVIPQIDKVYGIDSLIWIPLMCIAINAFFMSYQNMFALVGEANMKGKGWTSKHLGQYGIVYFVVSMLTMLIAIPYWISIGMF